MTKFFQRVCPLIVLVKKFNVYFVKTRFHEETTTGIKIYNLNLVDWLKPENPV